MNEPTAPVTRNSAPRLADTSDPKSLSTRFRARRDIRLRSLIERISSKNGSIRILDLGGSVEYWRRVGVDFLKSQNANIVVLNYTESELKSNDDRTGIFTTIVGDACDLRSIESNAFDLVHSNSVVEHVGDWARMKKFASEAQRVGSNYYIQTPYFWFPIDPHYYRAPLIHWMPRPMQARLITSFHICAAGKIANLDDAYSVLDGTTLIDRRQFEILFPEAEILRERVLGLTKSLIAIRIH
jgi:hypothetical protein